MSYILDAGALIAIDRGSRSLMALLKDELAADRFAVTHGGIVGQVWRAGGARQAALARALVSVRVLPLDVELGRRSGSLLARARRSDVIDAALVLLASDGDTILTSDPDDIEPLAETAGVHVDIVEV